MDRRVTKSQSQDRKVSPKLKRGREIKQSTSRWVSCYDHSCINGPTQLRSGFLHYVQGVCLTKVPAVGLASEVVAKFLLKVSIYNILARVDSKQVTMHSHPVQSLPQYNGGSSFSSSQKVALLKACNLKVKRQPLNFKNHMDLHLSFVVVSVFRLP